MHLLTTQRPAPLTSTVPAAAATVLAVSNMLTWPKLAPTSRPRRAAGLSYWGLNESCALTYVCLLSSSWAAESANAVAALTAAVIAGGCARSRARPMGFSADCDVGRQVAPRGRGAGRGGA